VFSDGGSGISFTAERAAHELRTAEKLTQRQPRDLVDAQFNRIEAARAYEESKRLLTPPRHLVGSAATELVPPLEYPGCAPSMARLSYTNTLLEPNVISVDAAEQRATLATHAGSLSSALDAAVTAGAKNSIEKMLCHQIALSHHHGMKLFGVLENSIRPLPPAEQVRLGNLAVRLFECCQSGALTLQKLQNGGAQRVIVQRVNVEPGGQAVVAGQIESGPSLREND
jgi:hypothetical protein